MIKVIKSTLSNIDNGTPKCYFEFEVDNCSPPSKTYQLGLVTYLIDNGSIATDVINKRSYVYNDGKWVKTTYKEIPKDSSIVENGSHSVPNNDIGGLVSVNVKVEPNAEDVKASVVFYDYDGTVVKSYGKNQFLELESLPDNPTHEGLTAQGWNWNLEDAKDYVSKYGELNVGQQYVTDDGATRLYVNLKENRTTPTLTLFLYANSELDVDWGDGSEHSTLTSDSDAFVSEQHIYSDTGEYVISIKVVSGSFSLKITSASTYQCSTILNGGGNYSDISSRIYAYTIEKVEIGENVEIGDSSFEYCENLVSISMPNSITALAYCAFDRCISLKYCTVPENVKVLPTGVFGTCSILRVVSLPNGLTNMDTACLTECIALESLIIPETCTTFGMNIINNASALTSLTIPDTVTDIGNNMCTNAKGLVRVKLPSNLKSIGNNAFVSCVNLIYIELPESLESIGNAIFADCRSLTNMTIPSKLKNFGGKGIFSACNNLISVIVSDGVEIIDGTSFLSCSNLRTVILPDSVTLIRSSAFAGCSLLMGMVLPKNANISEADGLFSRCTSLYSVTLPTMCEHLPTSLFYNCTSLQSVTIPATVSSMGNAVFNGCSSLKSVRFLGTEDAPTVLNTSFQNLPTTTIIYAPALVVNKYMNASYFPSKSTYKYVGFATYEDGETLPTKTSDNTHNLTWYATTEDAVAQTNPITVGNGNEVYARATAV